MTDRHDDQSERIGAAIQRAVAGIEAPEDLRARLAADRARGARRRLPAWSWAAAAIAIAAAVALVVVALPSSSAGRRRPTPRPRR